MSSPFAKEFRMLLPAVIVAGIGSIVPPVDDLTAMLAALASFGGFAVLAAMVFGVEFQQRTLGLLLSQPVERYCLWQQKLQAVIFAGLVLALLNWRVQQLLADLEPATLLVVWMFFIATACASGFWIRSVGSVLGGLACSITNQLLVFGSLLLFLRRRNATDSGGVLLPIFQASAVYALTLIWLGRAFWKGAWLKIGLPAIFVLLLAAVSQFLVTHFPTLESYRGDLWFVGMFMLATACSAGFWTMISRTTVGGAALSVASQFLAGVIVVLVFAWIHGQDADVSQGHFLGPLALFAPLYCTVFLWLGWRKFARLELREAPDGENLVRAGNLPQSSPWFCSWFRCRAGQSLRNLVRKELRLQKPLLTLAGLFLVVWLAAICLRWVRPGYNEISDVVICLYAPVALLLAGCISLGDEKSLGLTAWHLALPISVPVQWLLKLVVAAATGMVLGLLLPLALHWVAAQAGSAYKGASTDAYLAIALVSVTLFVLGFWAATLLNNTVRAALFAVFAPIGLGACIALGVWCGQHFELLRNAVPPLVNWLVIPVTDASGTADLSDTAFFLGLIVAAGVALLQSLRQFQRIRLSTATLIKAPLLLAGVFVILGFVVQSMTNHYLARP